MLDLVSRQIFATKTSSKTLCPDGKCEIWTFWDLSSLVGIIRGPSVTRCKCIRRRWVILTHIQPELSGIMTRMNGPPDH